MLNTSLVYMWIEDCFLVIWYSYKIINDWKYIYVSQMFNSSPSKSSISCNGGFALTEYTERYIVTLVPFAAPCVELVVQFPARGSTQVLLCLFPGVLWLWHFLYSVGPHPVSSLHIYTFVVSRAFMAGVASQAGDADSCRTPGLTSGLQGPWMSTVVFYCWCHSDSASVLLYFTFFSKWHNHGNPVDVLKSLICKWKRKRSGSILWQKPLYQEKIKKKQQTNVSLQSDCRLELEYIQPPKWCG